MEAELEPPLARVWGVSRFDKAESVGLPPRRLLAVDIGGLGTYRRYGMVPVLIGTGSV